VIEKPSGRVWPVLGSETIPSLNAATATRPLCPPLSENSTGPPVTSKPTLTTDSPSKRSSSKSPSSSGSPVPAPPPAPLLVTTRLRPPADTVVSCSA
jgi:hypothetical protein